MNIRHFFVLFVALLGGSALCAQDTDCGNKHKNLVILQNALGNTPGVMVPAFKGISSARVEAFLNACNPEILGLYTRVIQELSGYVPGQSDVRRFGNKFRTAQDNQTYAPFEKGSLEDRLRWIKTLIRYYFDGCSYNKAGGYWQRDYNIPRFPFSAEEKQFFATLQLQKKLLMVRSTGIEDSQTVANAGGNATVVGVYPREDFLYRAMEQVVASYFGMQSLKNRLAGGEDLLETPLCIPVLLQEMIGEAVGGVANAQQIPISGVAFTTNPALSSPGFSVTEINAAYGHGEGVVANKVVTDRYYVTKSKADQSLINIYPVIRVKQERLVPAGNSVLQTKQNDAALKQKSALSQAQVKKLYDVLKKIESAYGQPMDVEFVVVDTMIYIVQARPAMKRAAKPTYTDLAKASPQAAGTPVSVGAIVPGTSEVIIITSPEQLIATKTLDEADQKPNSGTCKAVIVQEWASSLSHAAVNFMGHGIPCLYTHQFASIAEQVAQVSEQNPLVIDVQKRMVFLWQDSQRPVASIVQQGWFEHPIDRAFSLFDYTGEQVRTFANPTPLDGGVVGLMTKLKTAPTIAEQQALCKELTERVQQRLTLTERRMKHFHIGGSDVMATTLAAFKNEFNAVVAEINACLNSGAGRFELLFYYKILESLLYQEVDTKKILGAFTYTYFLNNLFAKQHMLVILGAAGTSAQLKDELAYVQYITNKALVPKWTDFVKLMEECYKGQNESVKQHITRVRQVLSMLQKMDTLPLWFSTDACAQLLTLPQQIQGLDAAAVDVLVQETVEKFNAGYPAELLGVMYTCKEALEALHNTEKSTFANKQEAEEVRLKIQEGLIDSLENSAFKKLMQECSVDVAVMACDVLQQIVHVIDKNIKTVKISTAMSLEDRVDCFKAMLEGFHQFMHFVLRDVMPENALEYHGSWPLDGYLATVERRLQNVKAQASHDVVLQRSPYFSVQAAVIGSATEFSRHYPQNAEDLFMLIHQNSLVGVAAIASNRIEQIGLDKVFALPTIVQDALAVLKQAQQTPGAFPEDREVSVPKQIGVRNSASKLEILYNMSLRNHSSTFQIIYDYGTQECNMAIQFLGPARDRWAEIYNWVEMLEQQKTLKLAKPLTFIKAESGEVSWSWLIKNKADMDTSIKEMVEMAAYANSR